MIRIRLISKCLRNDIDRIILIALMLLLGAIPASALAHARTAPNATNVGTPNLYLEERFASETFDDERVSRALQKAREIEGRKILYLPDGVLNLSGTSGSAHLKIDDIDNLTLIGKKTRLVFHDTKLPGIFIDRASNLAIQGVSIEWYTPPNALGILHHARGEIELLEDTPTGHLKNISKSTKIWATPVTTKGKRVLSFGSGVIPLEKTKFLTILKVREDHVHKTVVKSLLSINRVSKVTVVGRNIGANGITIKSSSNIELRNIEILNSPSMGILARDVTNLIVTHSKIGIAYPNSVTNADGLHIISPSGVTEITYNYFTGLHDDGLVISNRGEYACLDSDNTNKVKNHFTIDHDLQRAIPLHHQPLERGSTFFREKKAKCPPKRKVVIFPTVDQATRITIAKNHFIGIRPRGIRINHPSVEVRGNFFSQIAGTPIRAGTYIGSRWTPQDHATGLEVVDNVFANNYACGKLIPVDVGVFPRNITRGFESQNVTISNNRERCD